MRKILRSRWLSLIAGSLLFLIAAAIVSLDGVVAIYSGIGLGAVAFLLLLNAVPFG